MSYSVRIDHPDHFYHYGVKGMKWGVRRTPEELGHKPTQQKEEVSSDFIEKLFGKPIAKLPDAKFKNPKVQKAYDTGKRYIQPYFSPGGLAFLTVAAVIPGFGVGTMVAAQVAYDKLKESWKLDWILKEKVR